MEINDRIITFESYYDPMLAHIIRTRLEANGISCFIADDNMIWAKPYLNQALYGVKLKMFEKDVTRCLEILTTNANLEIENSFEIDTNTNTIIVCPYCASANIRRGVAMRFRFHWPSVLLSLLVGIPVYFRTAWHCFNCGRDFE